MSLAFSGPIVKGEKGREYSELKEIASDGSLQFHGLGDELPLFPSIAISSIDCNLYLQPGKAPLLAGSAGIVTFSGRKFRCTFTLGTELVGFLTAERNVALVSEAI